MKRIVGQRGFTLIEILVALFIFAILSLLMTEGLRRIIRFHDGSMQQAMQLRELQFAFLIFSRDLEQAVGRASTNSFGQKEAAFIGTPTQLTFTHGGFAGAFLYTGSSQLQRVSYSHDGDHFYRSSQLALDATKKTPTTMRVLANNMQDMRFEYYSRAHKRFYDNWPLKDESNEALPSAVRLYVTIPNLGKMSQLYVIPAGS